MNMRTKYKIFAFLTPSCWSRNRPAHKAFDNWLWSALNHCELKPDFPYCVIIDGHQIWVGNEMYANGYAYGREHLICGRATAILLSEKVAKLKDAEFNVMFRPRCQTSTTDAT